MRDDDCNTTARSNATNGVIKRSLTFTIQIGVRLIQNQQERVTMKCPYQCNSLALTTGQGFTMSHKFCVIAFRQRNDQIMNPGGTTPTASTVKLWFGDSSLVCASCSGISASSRSSRPQLWRADTKPRQLAIARSIGAIARATRIEPAIMIPPVA